MPKKAAGARVRDAKNGRFLPKRIFMFRKTLSFVMVLLVFSMPLQVLAQQTSDAAQAIMDAERDADQANQLVWLGVGFLCGVFGIPIAYLAEPSVHPKYILHYTHVYKKRVGVQRAAWSSIGGTLGLASCIGGAYFVQFILDSTSTTD